MRAAEIDKVQIASCFRPGDIVKAEVVSLGTSRDYYLSTAQNHLGVVYAKSLAGSACEMLCHSSVLLHTDAAEAVNWWSVQLNLASRVPIRRFLSPFMSVLQRYVAVKHCMSR